MRFSSTEASRARGMLIDRYNSAVSAASSSVAPVSLACTLYCLVSSITVITEQTDVSLNMAMKSLVTGGTTIRTACGMMIRRRARAGDMPSGQGGFHLAAGNGLQAGAIDLRFVGRVVDRQPGDRGAESGNGQADLRQQEENHEQLQHQRRAAQDLDVPHQQPAQRRRAVQAADRHQQPQQHRQRHRQARQKNRHAGGFD